MSQYYDAETEKYVVIDGNLISSAAGYGNGPEYSVLYKLNDGRYLRGTRHKDRGDLMTRIKITKTKPRI